MIVSNKKCINNDFNVSINGTPLKKCDKYKYLGVTIDKNLNWKSHIEYISGKISKASRVLSKLRHCLSSKLLVEIYYALVHSYVRYGILTWGNASDTTLKPLQTMINRVVRIITFAPFGHIDLKPIYKDLQLLDVRDTFFLETSKFMFKVKNDLLPVTFANHFENNNLMPSLQSSYSLRSRVRVNRVVTRLLASENSIQVRGENIWNEIPDIIKHEASLYTFKRLIKCMLLEN